MSTVQESEIRLAQVALMHYENGMSQQEIAAYMGVSKMTISRMLQRAREIETVQIRVRTPFALSGRVAEKIEKEYAIPRVLVAKSPQTGKEELRALVGKLAAFDLGTRRLTNCVLGLGVGGTIGQVAVTLTPMRTKSLHVVQLMGGLPNVSSDNPFTIVQEVCRRLSAEGTFISSHAVVETAEYQQHFLYKTKMGETLLSLWKHCDVAVFGIGSIQAGTLLSDILVSPEELHSIKDSGGIGDILGHCFDDDGEFIYSDIEKRLVSIPTHMLKDVKERIAVVAGEEKARAIRGALRSGIVTTLITEERTAKLLV